MSPATRTTTDLANGQKLTVRFDSQEENFITPLRGYFASHGCTVVVNGFHNEHADYHIVCGDLGFVKTILTQYTFPAGRRMVIVRSHILAPEEFFASHKVFVVYHDALQLSDDEAIRMLHTFFTGEGRSLDMRKNPKMSAPLAAKTFHEQPHDVNGEGTTRERKAPKADRERISVIMDEIFQDSQKNKGKKFQFNRRAKSSRHKEGMRWGIVLFVCLLPIFWHAVSLAFSGLAIAGSATLLQRGNVSWSLRVSKWAAVGISQAHATLRVIRVPLDLARIQAPVRSQEQFLSLFTQALSATRGAAGLVLSTKDLSSQLLTRAGETTGDAAPASWVEKLRTELFSVHNDLSLTQAQINQMVQDRIGVFALSPIAAFAKQADSVLAKQRETLTVVDNLLALYPRIAGFRKPQTYLVLLQNSMELRPTGGFIGSVAVVTFEDGRMTDLEILDVYTLDGQLKGHVDPPLPVRNVLGQEHWYLRDSNWDPDFRVSGERALWFYQKETGKSVDGVIGVSLPFIVDMLASVGPVELSDYQDRITSQNFFGKSLFYTQENFFPGSTQKKDFLGALASKLLDHITHADLDNPAGVFRALSKSLVSGDIQFYFPDWELASLVHQFGWDGALPTVSSFCNAEACTSDFVAVIEANLGVNKANYFVKRTQEHTIVFDEFGKPTYSATLVWRNDSKGKPADSGGAYRAYVRLIVPRGLRVTSVTLDGVEVDRVATGRSTLPYTEEAHSSPGVDAVGVALEVGAGQAARLVIVYTTSAVLSFTQGGALFEKMFVHQPGTTSEDMTIRVQYPVFWNVEQISVPSAAPASFAALEAGRYAVVAKQGQLEYNTTLTQHAVVRFRVYK